MLVENLIRSTAMPTVSRARKHRCSMRNGESMKCVIRSILLDVPPESSNHLFVHFARSRFQSGELQLDAGLKQSGTARQPTFRSVSRRCTTFLPPKVTSSYATALRFWIFPSFKDEERQLSRTEDLAWPLFICLAIFVETLTKGELDAVENMKT